MTDPLAYYTAKTNGLDDTALDVLEEAGMTEDDLPPPPQNSGHSTLAPPSVTFPQADSNWPIKNLGESFFDRALANGSTERFTGQEPTPANGDQLDAWANEDVDIDNQVEGEDGDEDEGWDLDAEVIPIPEDEVVEDDDDQVVEGDLSEGVSAGVGEDEMWIRNSPLAADHAAAGAFESAMQVGLCSSSLLLLLLLRPLLFLPLLFLHLFVLLSLPRLVWPHAIVSTRSSPLYRSALSILTLLPPLSRPVYLIPQRQDRQN